MANKRLASCRRPIGVKRKFGKSARRSLTKARYRARRHLMPGAAEVPARVGHRGLFPKPLGVKNHTKGVVGGLFDRSCFGWMICRMRSAIHVVKNVLT